MDTNTQINKYPLVSILMLTYNRANFIEEAISSVLSQSYENFELIIIDDASTDNTTAVVYSFTDPRIKYHKEDVNQNLIVRRKQSLTYAAGEYIAVLDSDDLWSNTEKLKLQVDFLENEPKCAVIGTFITTINNLGTELRKVTYHVADKAIRNNILLRNQFAHSSVLIRKSALKMTGGYSAFSAAEDLDLFLKLGQHGSFANLPLYLTKYRVHNSGESADKLRLVSFILKIIKAHKKNYPNYYLAWLKYNLYRYLIKLKKLASQD